MLDRFLATTLWSRGERFFSSPGVMVHMVHFPTKWGAIQNPRILKIAGVVAKKPPVVQLPSFPRTLKRKKQVWDLKRCHFDWKIIFNFYPFRCYVRLRKCILTEFNQNFWFSYPPRKLTWNLKMMVSNRNLLFQGFIFRFHVSFAGCISIC